MKVFLRTRLFWEFTYINIFICYFYFVVSTLYGVMILRACSQDLIKYVSHRGETRPSKSWNWRNWYFCDHNGQCLSKIFLGAQHLLCPFMNTFLHEFSRKALNKGEKCKFGVAKSTQALEDTKLWQPLFFEFDLWGQATLTCFNYKYLHLYSNEVIFHHKQDKWNWFNVISITPYAPKLTRAWFPRVAPHFK